LHHCKKNIPKYPHPAHQIRLRGADLTFYFNFNFFLVGHNRKLIFIKNFKKIIYINLIKKIPKLIFENKKL